MRVEGDAGPGQEFLFEKFKVISFLCQKINHSEKKEKITIDLILNKSSENYFAFV
jgi:hypothetical protein